MSSYAPRKSKAFWRLKTLLWKPSKAKPDEPKKADWKQAFAAFSAWAEKRKGKG